MCSKVSKYVCQCPEMPIGAFTDSGGGGSIGKAGGAVAKGEGALSVKNGSHGEGGPHRGEKDRPSEQGAPGIGKGGIVRLSQE